MSDEPILKQAQDKLKPFEPKLLDAFSRVFARKKPPQSMRALAPLAMVFLLEAFGLAYLLDRATVRLAVLACRGPGKGEDDDLLDDSDEMTAIRWAAARHEAIDRAYNAVARDLHKNSSTGLSFVQWLKAGYGPSRAEFERQWGERNPIDPATAPKCFDPSAQLSILDAVGQGDGYLGVFVSTSFLASSAPKQITSFAQTLDLEGCETIEAAAARAVLSGWIAYLDHRGVIMGLRLIPRTDAVQTRLRAPLANIVAMYAPDKRDEQIAQLEAKIAEHEEMRRDLDRQWQIATGASDPEMAAELTAQRVEQIQELTAERDTLRERLDIAHSRLADPAKVEALQNIVEAVETPSAPTESSTVPRMIWPDPLSAPSTIECASAITAHRRNEFAEVAFPVSQYILANVRAWLRYHNFTICDPAPDATGYATCAIGANGETPPSWASMSQTKRNTYPGFVLFAPDESARVVFGAKEPSAKPGKRGKKGAKS